MRELSTYIRPGLVAGSLALVLACGDGGGPSSAADHPTSQPPAVNASGPGPFPGAPSTPPKPVCGVPRPRFTSTNELDTANFNVILTRSNQLVDSQYYAASSEMYSIDPFTFAMNFSTLMEFLYDGESPRPDLVPRHVRRFRSISPEETTAWKVALAQPAMSGDLSVPLIAWMLTAVDQFFEDDTYNPKFAGEYRSRLETVEAHHVAQWVSVFPTFADIEPEAALGIVLLDEIFSAGQLNEETFQAWLRGFEGS